MLHLLLLLVAARALTIELLVDQLRYQASRRFYAERPRYYNYDVADWMTDENRQFCHCRGWGSSPTSST